MIDSLPRSHAAIFDTPQRKLPRSLLWGILFAAAVHGGLAFYFLTVTFAPAPEVIYDPGPITIVDTLNPAKPKDPPKPQPTVVKVHDPVSISPNAETTPVMPTKGPDIVTDQLPVLATEPVIETPEIGTVPTGPTYVDARWSRFPDAQTLASYYPQHAIENEKTGTATVECTVLDASGRVGCTVVTETPKGYGFGKATAAMIASVGRVDTSQGNIRTGSILRKTVTWALDD